MLLKFFKLSPQKMVIVVRTDLYMGRGKIASQCSHAAIELYRKSRNRFFWLIQGQPKVILKVESGDQLIKLYEKAKANNLNATVIYDAGRTQIDPGTATVLGIGPSKVETIDNITGHLKLL